MRSPMHYAGILSVAIFGITSADRVLGETGPLPVVPLSNASCFQGAQHSCCMDDGDGRREDICDKTRFISFTLPTDSVAQTALRVKLISLHHVNPPYSGVLSSPFTAFEGLSVYVGPPSTFAESTSSAITFKSAQTQCQPYYQDWTTVGLLHVRGSAIVPSSTYQVEVLAPACLGVEDSVDCQSGGSLVSPAVDLRTTRWGDVESPYNPPQLGQPDFSDCGSLVNKFRGAISAPIKARGMIQPNDHFGNITDTAMSQNLGFDQIAASVDAFRGRGYPGKMGKCASANNACTTSAECGADGPCNLYCP